MKMSREMRRAAAIRKNRFKMLSWDPSHLFHEMRDNAFWAGYAHAEDAELTRLYEKLRCSDQPWAIEELDGLRRIQQGYDRAASLYYEYATIILMYRAKMSVEERCRIDLEARSSAPMRLPSDP